MGLALFKERRIVNRRRLTGLLPGRMVNAETGKDMAVKPVDISPNGLGIIIDSELEPGMEIHLKIKDRDIKFQVAWGQPDFGKNDRFRYGLVTLEPSDDIEKEFLESGCLV
jgi:hypothetical protein